MGGGLKIGRCPHEATVWSRVVGGFDRDAPQRCRFFFVFV